MGLPTTGVSIVDIYDKMPTYSLCLLDLNNSNMIVDGPESGSGLLEICKIAGRNFARYTKSNSSASSIEGMWYGSFRWSPDTKFLGWHKIASTDDIISKSDVTLKIYYSLSSAGIPTSAKLTMKDIWDKLPDGSYLIAAVEGVNDITDLPSNDAYGVLEIYKKSQKSRNYTRFTPSLSSAAAGSMFYGTFAWSTGSTVFTGWKRIIESSRLANNLTTTAEEYALDARQGKALNDKITSMQSSFQDGVDTLYNKCKSCGSTPSNKTPTAISNSIQSIYTNRYNNGRTQGIRDRVYTIYNSSESSTNHGNLSLTMTSPPSIPYTDRPGTWNINITNKMFHKITIDVISRLSLNFSGSPTCGIEVRLTTAEGSMFYQDYIQQHGSDGNNANDGKTYQYTFTLDVMGCKFSTSSDHVVLYVNCFFHRNGANINSVNLQFTANNIKTYYK